MQSTHIYSRVMVSAIGPEAHSNQISKSLVPWGCGNEQRLTIDVTPSPRLEDLRQGPRMPGHASYSSLGTIQATRLHITRGYPSGSTRLPSNSVKSNYPCVHNIKGIRGITLVGFLLDVSVKVNSEESPSMGSHLMCCMTGSYRKWSRRNHPR